MPPVRRRLAAPTIGAKVVDHVPITEIELGPVGRDDHELIRMLEAVP